jgi:hypothetical protein
VTAAAVGMGLEAAGVVEPRAVVADLGEQASAGQCVQAGEAGDRPPTHAHLDAVPCVGKVCLGVTQN